MQAKSAGMTNRIVGGITPSKPGRLSEAIIGCHDVPKIMNGYIVGFTLRAAVFFFHGLQFLSNSFYS